MSELTTITTQFMTDRELRDSYLAAAHTLAQAGPYAPVGEQADYLAELKRRDGLYRREMRQRGIAA